MENYLSMSFLNKNDYEQKNIQENILLVIYSVIALTIPIMLQGPQLIVGSIVNVLLILGAQHVSGKKLLALIFMPSIGVIISGVLFSSLTSYLLYFLPVIWLGNAFLVLGYKYFRFQKKSNKTKAIIKAISGKVLILGLTALTLVSLNIVPSIFLYAMGFIQIITATAGAIIAFSLTKAFNRSQNLFNK